MVSFPFMTLSVGILAAITAGCDRSVIGELVEPVIFTAQELREIQKLSPLPDIPPSPTNLFADDPKAAWLGQRMFYDGRLSSDGQVSCATCHDPNLGFSDGKPLSEGLGTTDRHSQSLWNVAYQRWFFWDGRVDSLWAQAVQPLQDAREMGATPQHLQNVVAQDPILKSRYEALFGSISEHSQDQLLSNLGKTFEAYQRKLISNGSDFDAFVADIEKISPGDDQHLNESARRGLKFFVGRGRCILCHAGPNLSDNEFHNIGLKRNPDLPRDSGRFEGIRKLKADRFIGTGDFSDDRSRESNIKLPFLVVKMNNMAEFKTPTLRSVAETAPYMHDGRFATLRDVLDHYSELPGDPPLGHREETLQPLKLSDNEKDDIEAFLRTLTGASLPDALTSSPPLD
ncbi:MAG: cytochrome c peroxidase [Verrucomicrobiales bacterium]|jgi:cytochrome c peroxidase